MPFPDAPRFRAEEYSDLSELRALAELIGKLVIHVRFTYQLFYLV